MLLHLNSTVLNFRNNQLRKQRVGSHFWLVDLSCHRTFQCLQLFVFLFGSLNTLPSPPSPSSWWVCWLVSGVFVCNCIISVYNVLFFLSCQHTAVLWSRGVHPAETIQRRHGGDDGDHHSSDSCVSGHWGKREKHEVSLDSLESRHGVGTGV